MPTVAGQSTDPLKPGILGTPMNINIPATQAIGVKGDGGAGFPPVIPLAPGTGRRGIGVLGTSADPQGVGVWGENTAGGPAGQFDGNLQVNGNASVSGTLTVVTDIILTSADCAEEFDVAEGACEPGTVMVVGENGLLQAASRGYDKRVAGVVSGAGDYKPAIVLDKRQSRGKRVPVALLGKVYCKVDAEFSPVELGDLLTTSPTLGHAMKAADSSQAFGSVIGKALRRLDAGRGLIPILMAMQ
jgi:hypothetical protein